MSKIDTTAAPAEFADHTAVIDGIAARFKLSAWRVTDFTGPRPAPWQLAVAVALSNRHIAGAEAWHVAACLRDHGATRSSIVVAGVAGGTAMNHYGALVHARQLRDVTTQVPGNGGGRSLDCHKATLTATGIKAVLAYLSTFGHVIDMPVKGKAKAKAKAKAAPVPAPVNLPALVGADCGSPAGMPT